MSEVRVRFSSKSYRTITYWRSQNNALYNYLLQKNKGGKMILRIEDTDQNRFVEGAEEYLIDALSGVVLI